MADIPLEEKPEDPPIVARPPKRAGLRDPAGATTTPESATPKKGLITPPPPFAPAAAPQEQAPVAEPVNAAPTTENVVKDKMHEQTTIEKITWRELEPEKAPENAPTPEKELTTNKPPRKRTERKRTMKKKETKEKPTTQPEQKPEPKKKEEVKKDAPPQPTTPPTRSIDWRKWARFAAILAAIATILWIWWQWKNHNTVGNNLISKLFPAGISAVSSNGPAADSVANNAALVAAYDALHAEQNRLEVEREKLAALTGQIASNNATMLSKYHGNAPDMSHSDNRFSHFEMTGNTNCPVTINYGTMVIGSSNTSMGNKTVTQPHVVAPKQRYAPAPQAAKTTDWRDSNQPSSTPAPAPLPLESSCKLTILGVPIIVLNRALKP